MKKNKKFKISLALALAVVLTGSVFMGWRSSISSNASFDPNSCILFRNYSEASSLPSATIWVGTYLISLNKATDSVYEKAKASAEASGQGDTYYKSELSDGTWYKITSAKTLNEIQPSGTPVDESELSNLYVKFYIDEKGIVHDLLTGEEGASLYNDPNPYAKWYMEEYEPMTGLINDGYLSATEQDASLKFYYDMIYEHLNYDNVDDYTDECDTKLSNVEKLKNLFESSDGENDADYAEGLSDVLDSIDGDRKSHYIANVLNDEGFGGISDVVDASKYPWEYSSAKTADEKCQTAIATTKSNLQEAYEENISKVISDPGETAGILERERYKCFVEIVSYDASAGITDSIRETVKEFVCIENILNDEVVLSSDELALIEEFLPEAIEEYKSSIGAGVCAQYATAYSQNSEISGLIDILENQSEETNVLQMQVRKLIEAKELRIEEEEKTVLLAEKLDEAYGFYEVIKNDVYYDYANGDLAGYIKYLSEELDSAYDSLDSSTEDSATAELEEKKANFESQKQEAEAKNDLAKATDLQVMIDDLDKKIASASTADAATETEETAKAETVAKAKTTVSNLKAKLKAKAKEDIVSGNADSDAFAMMFAMGDDDDITELTEEIGLDSDNMVKALLKAAKKLNNALEGVDEKTVAAKISEANADGSISSENEIGSDASEESSDDSLNDESVTSETTDDTNNEDSSDKNNSDSTETEDTAESSEKSDSTDSSEAVDSSESANTSEKAETSETADKTDTSEDENKSSEESKDEEGLGDTTLVGDAAALLDNVLEEATSDEDSAALDELAEKLGADSDSLSVDDKAAIIAAAANGDIDLSDSLKNRLVADLMSSGLIYDTYIDDNNTFVSLMAVQNTVGFRYVFDKDMTNAHLQAKKSGLSYSFTDGSATVIYTENKDTMGHKAKLIYGSIYIDNEAAEKYFGISGIQVTGTDYSLALDDEAMEASTLLSEE